MKKHAVLVGINEYQKLGLLGNLRFARQDAEAVADALKKCYGFSENEITLMTDNRSDGKCLPNNRYAIEDALASEFYAENLDLFVFGFWGHGIWENDQRYLCPMDVRDNRLTSTALPLKTVQELLGRIRAKNICLILDCCQNEVSTESRSAAQSMTSGKETSLDLLARDIVLDLKKSVNSGPDPTVVILNSCKKGERAFESVERGHGLFTAELLEAMEKRCDNTETLYQHVRTRVPELLRATGRHQTPYYTSEGAPSIVLPAVQKGYDVFLSYRRSGGSEVAKLLQTQLENRHLRVFLDVNESMAGGSFDKALLTRIEESACFVPVLSSGCFSRPDAMSDSDWVYKEFLHAVRKHKPIVPVFSSGFAWEREKLPERVEWLRKVDGIEYHPIYVDGFLTRLVNAVRNPGNLNHEAILEQMTAPAGEVYIPPVEPVSQPSFPPATDEKGLVEEFDRELKTAYAYLEDYIMTAPRVVQQLDVLREVCARLVKVRKENLALWNREYEENRKEGMREDRPKMVELKGKIDWYGVLLESYPCENATLDEMEAFAKGLRTVNPGNVTLPPEFHPNPRKYEKFWEQKGISGEIALSRDGKFLAVTCGNDIKILEFSTGKVLQTLEGHTDYVLSVSYSPDGRFIASGSDDKTVRIWNAQTGDCVKTLEGHTHWVSSVSYSPDGRFIASGSGDNTVRIWNAQTGDCVKTLEGHEYGVNSVSYSPDGRFIASGSRDNTVRIWNAQTGDCVKTLEGHEYGVNSVSYSPDGRFIASGSRDNTVRIWNAQTGDCVKTLEGHTSSVNSVSYSPDGRFIASGSGFNDKTVRIWNAQTGDCVKTLEGHTSFVESVSYSPDGRFIASGSDEKTVRIWNAQTGDCVKTLEGHTSSVNSVSYSPDGRFIASGSRDKTVRIWNAQTGACVKTLEGHTNYVNSVSYSPDGRFIASGSDDETVRIWNAQTGDCVKTLEGHTKNVKSVSYSPDGRFIASGSEDETVRIWNAQTGACVKTLEGHTDGVYSVSYSPDGRFIASGSNDNTVRIWNAQTGECVKTLKGHTHWVCSVSYSPDGRFIASGSWDDTVRIWNAQTGECVKTLEGYTRTVNSLSYSPDGKYLSAGASCGLTVWRVED